MFIETWPSVHVICMALDSIQHISIKKRYYDNYVVRFEPCNKV